MLYKGSFKYLLVIAAVLVLFSSCKDSTVQDNQSPGIPVSVMRVNTRAIENVTQVSGLVMPRQIAYVAVPLPGKVEQTFYDVGDYVEEGDLLFTVDGSEIEDNIRLLEEQLKVAEANVSLAEAGVATAMGSSYESQKIQLETALKSAEVNYATANEAFQSATLLFEAGLIDRSKYNQIKNQYHQANNALDSAIKAYELYITKISADTISSASEQLKQAQASCDMLKLQIENARKKLTLTKITSPISGEIASKDIVEGCLISNTMVPYTIIDYSVVQASAGVSERIVNKIGKGDKLEITIPSISNRPYIGKVSSISPAANEKTLLYNVLIDIDNPGKLIKPGMTVKVNITTEQHDNIIAIPVSSIMTDESDSFVFTVENNRAVKKTIDTGISGGDYIEVLGGIYKDELLVVKGQQFLKNGDPVIVTGEVYK